LFGVVSYWLNWLIKQRRLSKSVKALFTLENEKNKILLKEFWEIVSKAEAYWFIGNNEFNYPSLAIAINDVSFPHVSKI